MAEYGFCLLCLGIAGFRSFLIPDAIMQGGFIHDFDRAIGSVFGLPVYWYGAAYSIGFLGVFLWFFLRRSRLGWPMADVLDISIFLAVGVLVGGRAFDILVYEFGYYAAHPCR